MTERFDQHRTDVDPLRSSRLYLEPLEPASYPFLNKLINETVALTWKNRGISIRPEALSEHLWNDVLVQFQVVRARDRRVFGLVQCFSANLGDGHAHVAMLTDPSIDTRGWGFEAMVLFIGYLFTTFPLRKLYFEGPEFAVERYFGSAARLGFVEEEVRLKGHDWHRNRWWDWVQYALYRETFMKFLSEDYVSGEHLGQ